MEEQFIRTARLIGGEAVEKLAKSKVLLFGVGGVGSFAAEALARAGVGEITLVDGDTVAPSNLNRQLVALRSTIGRSKAEVMAERIRDINDKLKRGPEGEISTPNSKVKVYVICTNEELMIARDTKEIVEAL